ncbi:antirestriction protein [Cronobacter sakazakii]|nr:antirestriction protein [Cronobacter sakazakii]
MTSAVIPVATRIEGAQRLCFLPDLFGGDFVFAESMIYAFADRYCPDYRGGFWNFYRLPDGGGYMAPDVDTLTLDNAGNWFNETVSGNAAGFILTALVLNHRCWHHDSRGNGALCAHMAKRHTQLMSFVEYHPERALIWRALD